MRILIANDTYYPNVDGCSYFTQRLATRLQRRGHEVLVVAPSPTSHAQMFSHDGIQIAGMASVPSVVHRAYRISPPVFLRGAIERIVEDFQPEVVHGQNHFFIERAVADVAYSHGIPVIATSHFMPENLLHYAHLPTAVEPLVKRMVWKDFCRVYEKATLVTTPTQSAVAILQRAGLDKPAFAVSCGIDLQHFNPRHQDPHILESYRLPAQPILLCVGRLSLEKKIDLVLRALARLGAAVPMHLAIVGSGTERERLEQLVDDLGIRSRVTFLGFVPDEKLPALYASSTALVTACEVELQSLVTMEAMASGKPVIAVDALALPELVHDGKNGFVFKPGDEVGLSQCLHALFSSSSLCRAMGEESLRIIQFHDIEKTIDQFEVLYERVRSATAILPHLFHFCTMETCSNGLTRSPLSTDLRRNSDGF